MGSIRRKKKKPKAKRPVGRPPVLTPEVIDKIIYEISHTEKGIEKICAELDIDHSIVWRLRNLNQEFSDRYNEAKVEQHDLMASRTIEIADDSAGDIIHGERGASANIASVKRAELKINTRKWHLERLARKKYGTHTEVDMHIDGPSPAEAAWNEIRKKKIKRANGGSGGGK